MAIGSHLHRKKGSKRTRQRLIKESVLNQVVRERERERERAKKETQAQLADVLVYFASSATQNESKKEE